MNWETHMLTIILVTAPAHSNTAVANGTVSYVIGSVIALLIMGYLIYSLLRPDKF
ncbi:MAG TPA: K(+)-transporting ATPase subunit F [Bacteroidales bacterium]